MSRYTVDMAEEGQRETLAVVDDETETIALYHRIFRKKYRIISAYSAQEALEKTRHEHVSVALVDQRMPEMTGLDFLMEFGKTHPLAGRVVVTGYTDLDDIVALINEGRIHGFVVKPWNNHQLSLTVDREVENHRKARLIEELNAKLRREHRDMLSLLRQFDPDFAIPQSNEQLKATKNRLRQKVSGEIERLFLEQLLESGDGNVSAAARSAQINRTFLYRLMNRHGLLDSEASETDSEATAESGDPAHAVEN
mgnify:CR=1 FL=1